MTTIVWHGPSRTLAVDALATIRYGTNPLLRNEQAYKIIDLTPTKLVDRHGEKLLALALSGSPSGADDLLRFVIEGLGDWKGTAELVKKVGGTFLSRDNSTTSILITSKNAYVINMNNGVQVMQFKLNDFVAVGSGGTAAYAAYRAYGATARDAVLTASATDPGTGFLIFTVKVSAKGLSEHRGEYVNDLQVALHELRSRPAKVKEIDIAKKHGRLEKRMGDLDGLFSSKRLKEIRDEEQKKGKAERARKRKIREEKTAQKSANVKPTEPAKTVVLAKKAVTPSRRKNQPT